MCENILENGSTSVMKRYANVNYSNAVSKSKAIYVNHPKKIISNTNLHFFKFTRLFHLQNQDYSGIMFHTDGHTKLDTWNHQLFLYTKDTGKE